MHRSLGITLLVTVAVLFAIALGRSKAQAQSTVMTTEVTIPIVARRFVYSPNEIVLKKGQPVVLEFTAIDFRHGFSIPDLNIRADLPPDKVTQVRLMPNKAGSFEFLCDNFCGSDHEDMGGRILVQE